MGVVYVCAGTGRVISFSFSKDLGNCKGSLSPFSSIVIHLIPLYLGLGVTAPACTQLLVTVVGAVVAYFFFTSGAFSLNLNLNSN